MLAGVRVKDLVGRARAAETRAVRAAKLVDATPLAKTRKRAKRLVTSIDALVAAIFFRTLALDYADEPDRDLVLAAEEPSLVLARWDEARRRLDAAAQAGVLAPGKVRETIEWASTDGQGSERPVAHAKEATD